MDTPPRAGHGDGAWSHRSQRHTVCRGETTVSRCVLRLASGETGFGYVLGRDKLQAELIALADAHLQTAQQDHWMTHMMEPLAQQWKQAQAEHSANVADSRVDFFTMVRGED